MSLTVKRKNGKWWITGPPLEFDVGPYETRREADDDRKGLERFEKMKDDRSRWTCD